MVKAHQGSLASTLLLATANLLIPVSIIIFAIGFFPYKPFLPGLAEYEALEYGPPPAAPFNKLIFMVVDALRSDFVYSSGSGFEYTQHLIRDGSAIPFTANARSPTVTMPRIKSITTGSIPSFVDLILNIDEDDTSSALANQDTWLAQLKAASEQKLLLFGDDTWLKLFPDTFDRADGTSSFFVADFTEVDNNVTRNVAPELENNDWSLMVLHYLGLDHIGHKSGPRSVNMVPKQREMDGIVKQIFEALGSKPHLESTLLVVCGDHGMNDAGNHGASSAGETSPALVFLSPKLKQIPTKFLAPTQPLNEFDYYSMVEQSDLAPTIAALLGFPVSKNNLGAFIPEFLHFWSNPKDKIQILIRNARQILEIVTAAFGPELFDPQHSIDPCGLEQSKINELACAWRKIYGRANALASADALDDSWVSLISTWLREAQDLMSSMASNYDMPKLFIGQGLALAAVLSIAITMSSQGTHRKGSPIPLILTAVAYGVMMFASSYVEEEHHFWYWSSSLWLMYIGIRSLRRSSGLQSISQHLITLVALRLIRSWNQTGQKFAGEPDLVKILLTPNPQFLWILIGLSYIVVCLMVMPNIRGLPFIAVAGLTSLLLSSSFSFKLAFTNEDAPELVVGFARTLQEKFMGPTLVWRARFVFGMISGLSIFAIFKSLTGTGSIAVIQASSYLLHHSFTLLVMAQSRATNIPVFLLSTVLLAMLQSQPLSIAEITTTSVLLQFTTFFALGGSNAISSADLSNAYNGVSSYNIIAVGILGFISNWAGPIFWTSATNLLLLEKYKQGERHVFRHHITLLTLFTTIAVASVMVACTALRAHLFIWTVFSPKYLYCIAWSLGQHLLINIGLGSFLFWIGAPRD